MKLLRDLIRRYDSLDAEMDVHLKGPIEDEYDEGTKYLICGCVVSNCPDVDDRCPIFSALARERWAIHESIFEELRGLALP